MFCGTEPPFGSSSTHEMKPIHGCAARRRPIETKTPDFKQSTWIRVTKGDSVRTGLGFTSHRQCIAGVRSTVYDRRFVFYGQNGTAGSRGCPGWRNRVYVRWARWGQTVSR